MNPTSEVATEAVKAVWFSLLTDEEVRKHSFLKITEPQLLDQLDRPLPGGLYDPALGSLDETSPCKTCGQRQFHCPGHFGHIDLVFPVYNPLLFNFLYNLLQRTCFFCNHFTAGRSEVEKCVSQLELIIKGDIVAAKRLDSVDESSNPEDSDGSHKSCSTVHSGARYDNVNHLKQQEWTSLQSSEAKSVLQNFLKIKPKKCRNCKAKNPSISKPTFGWIHMSGMSRALIRENIIRGCTIGESFAGETEPDGEDSSDVDTAETPAFGDASRGTQDTTGRRHQKVSGQVPAEFKNQKDLFSGPLLPSEAKNIVKNLWENEVELCSFITDMQQQGFGKRAGHCIFFLETILVPPIKFRLPSKGSDSVMEHPQTILLSKVLQCNIYLGNAYVNKSEHSKTIARWMDLQQSINVFFDGKTATGQGQKDLASGICQLLEKKEGLFRQKLMGKRVNFACRSVISPDPYLAVNEIGIPPYFALRLTYPERVTPWNVLKLRDAIINGSENHPGATHYVDQFNTMRLPLSRKQRVSISRKLPSSRGSVVQAGKDSEYELEGKTVYRHLQDGDVVLVNRQPTLHKPSIMAHVVRVLKGEKTLRMHYANCSTYNADFDGDEMNVHFPQDEISRAEAYNIVNANNQYVRPSNGDPLRALIQDHIVSAVLLTKKDTFLNIDEFNQLLYSSGVFTSGLGSFSSKPDQKVSILSSEEEVLLLQPTIWKPEPLWTGKQVITAVLNHITKGHPPFTVQRDGKIPQDFFKTRPNEGQWSDKKRNDKGKLSTKNKMGKAKQNKEIEVGENKPIDVKEADKNISKRNELNEEKLLIYKNDFVRGVIDKAQFADYGLVHTVQELYGSNTAGILLSALSRIFTVFLQLHGFTCGVNDLLIRDEKDRERKKQLEGCEKIGKEIHLKALQHEDDADVKDDIEVKDGDEIDPIKLTLKIEKTIRSGGEAAIAYFDRQMTGALNKCTSSGVINELLSEGLVKPTGKNCISLMTTSGAKGSKVNFQQISSHLGQQELEGKRVPRMVSGKTLPSFHPWDWTPRAGGFIIDRFLTGLRPQEYYFHCMAGREGLVDTAVKTSRSGYLQRCLIKNLECLKICYDHTVRDADGSIVQFLYGEDGVDVHQTSFITKFEALAANQDMIYKKCGDQLDASNGYIMGLPDALKDKAEKFVDEFPLKERIFSNLMKQQDFLKLLKHKFILSLAQPGEPVGLLASQSVGEPSTQMTLNTFHLAGRGEMNVTLGIPRLQEILTIASKDIKTPVMTCPLHVGKTEDDAKRLGDKLKKITVADIVDSMEVSVMPFAVHDEQTCSIYKLKMKLYEPKHYPKNTNISVKDWEETLEVAYVRELEDAIQNHMVLLSKISGIKDFAAGLSPKASNEKDEEVSVSRSKNKSENDDDADDEDGVEAEDLGLDAQKRKQQATDERDYEEDSEEELNEGASSAGFVSEIDQAENDDDDEHDESENEIDQAENENEISKDETSESLSLLEEPPTPSSSKKKAKSEVKRKKKARAKLVKKETDRAIYVAAKGYHFEVHFKFINEPHILLAQIAQNTAKKVAIQSSGKIEQCRVTNCKENQVIYYGKDPKKRVKMEPEEKEKIPAISTAGVDFNALWKLQDYLDIRYLYSNNIQAMLETYGVEAARETIIGEINHVFNSYGISVNIRHLSLIADFMTHSGGYRPMSRLGGIAESVSPFSKMTFETASKFIVEAAYYGEVDKLETPSARICLGLPVKVGTGSFDLMQKLEI
ncbi:DNA-directed RNA polymerase I subunit 1 [Pistacia vera]|uniref:DNA-directed RNA polymerase I subunit 1 n=1 Tax=Pistacia vera TaxID=55513 RepID=UPI0012633B01|nr:DNA-directed RNA polymerase I subunit 1 [Pistacia vera]